VVDVTQEIIAATADLFEAMHNKPAANAIRMAGLTGTVHHAAAEFLAAHAARAKAEGIEMAAKAAERCFGPHYPDEQTSCEIVTKTIRALEVGAGHD
jgi:hypothetical protein